MENQIVCECGHRFNFDKAIEKKYNQEGFLEFWTVCPNCGHREYSCKLSPKTVKLREIMLRRAENVRKEPTSRNKFRYQIIVKKYQAAFDYDNQ